MSVCAIDTEEEGDWPEKVTKDEFDGEFFSWLVDVEVLAPPGEEGVYKAKKSQHTEKSGGNQTGNLETQECTVGERVKEVGWLLLAVFWDDDFAGC